MMGKQVTTPKKKQDKKKPRQKRAAPGKRKRFSLPPNSIPGQDAGGLYGLSMIRWKDCREQTEKSCSC